MARSFEDHCNRTEENDDDVEISNGTVDQVSRGIQWIKKHPVLAAVVWMFGGSENATDYYKQLVEQAQAEDYAASGERLFANGDSNLLARRLSWSDQHGKNLAVVFDESERKSVSAPQLLYGRKNQEFHLPPKSALKKGTRSVDSYEQEMLQSILKHTQSKQFNSSSLKDADKGIMKKHIDSPQWGWYVNTSPMTDQFLMNQKLKEKSTEEPRTTPPQGIDQF